MATSLSILHDSPQTLAHLIHEVQTAWKEMPRKDRPTIFFDLDRD